jgi:hypothetical protein
MSDKVEKWVKRRPDSWVKNVKGKQTTLEDFKAAFKKQMQEEGKSYIIKYLKDSQWQDLWSTYVEIENINVNDNHEKYLRELKKEGMTESEAIKRLADEYVGREREVKSYTRNGEKVNGYKSIHATWDERQTRWLKSHMSEKVMYKDLTPKFNDFFKTNRSANSLRDKYYRITGKKN